MHPNPPQTWFCPRCGTSNFGANMHCGQCQTANPYGPPTAYPFLAPQVVHVVHHASPKSRAAYILLGLFLGGLGIHNFYAGHTGRGLAQLLLTVCTGWMCFPVFLIGLWILIEIIVTDTDGSGQRMS